VPPFVIHSSRGKVLKRSALNAGAGTIVCAGAVVTAASATTATGAQ
jgi:hypothetical protein